MESIGICHWYTFKMHFSEESDSVEKSFCLLQINILSPADELL